MGKCLRELKIEDAEHMLEWIRDSETSKVFRFDAANMDRDRIHEFINNCRNDEAFRHFAIVDRQDEYMGTISLKNIDLQAMKAEYAIVLRKRARGTGLAKKATMELLTFAFQELELLRVYLNVLSTNNQAIRFYQKLGFVQEGEFKDHVYVGEEIQSLKWFRMMKDEYIKCLANDEENSRENQE